MKVKNFFKKIGVSIKKGFNALVYKLKHLTKKQWLIIGAVFLVIVIAIVLALVLGGNDKKDVAKKDDKPEVINDSANIIKEATYEGLTINNIMLRTKGDYATFTAIVTNNTNEEKKVEDFDIVLKKGDTKVIALYAYLGDPLKPNETKEITASVSMYLPKKVVDTAEYTAHKKSTE